TSPRQGAADAERGLFFDIIFGACCCRRSMATGSFRKKKSRRKGVNDSKSNREVIDNKVSPEKISGYPIDGIRESLTKCLYEARLAGITLNNPRADEPFATVHLCMQIARYEFTKEFTAVCNPKINNWLYDEPLCYYPKNSFARLIFE